MSTRNGRSAAAAIASVAVVQVVACVATAVAWYFSTVFAGDACSPDCDWAAAEFARTSYISVVLLSLAATVGALVYSWRTAKDLSWVPLVGSAAIVIGFFVALPIFQSAMS